MQLKLLNYQYKVNYVKRILASIFISCVFFYTAFAVSQWQNPQIISVLSTVNQIINVVKYYELIPLLLLFETYDLLCNCLKNNKKFKKQMLSFLITIVVYRLMNIYCPYLRFNELVLVVYFSKYIKRNTLFMLFIIIYGLSFLFNTYGVLIKELPLTKPKMRGITFGFMHYNSFGLFVCMLYMAMVLRFKNKKALIYFLFFPTFTITWFIAKSRTPSYVLGVFIVLYTFKDIYDKVFPNGLKKFLKIMFVLTPILLFVCASIIAVLVVNGKISMDSNAAVRFKDFYNIYKIAGVSLEYRDLLDVGHYYLDMGYSQLLLKYGVVVFTSYMVGSTYANYMVAKQDDYLVMVVFIGIYLYLLMEFIMFFSDFPIIIISYMFLEE